MSSTPERKEELTELSKYLSDFFPSFGKGVRYLLELAGQVATRRKPPTRLSYILAGPTPEFQRGEAQLHDPEPHNIRRLRVQFHRYY